MWCCRRRGVHHRDVENLSALVVLAKQIVEDLRNTLELNEDTQE